MQPGRIVGAPVAVPYNPNFIAAGEGRVWGLATSGNTLVRFDTESEQVDVFSAGVDLGGREYGRLPSVRTPLDRPRGR